MSIGGIRTAIKTALESVSGIGIVTAWEPHIVREEDLQTYFVASDTEALLGWTITRESTGRREISGNTSDFDEHVFVIRGYAAINNQAASEQAFQDLVEAVMTRLRQEEINRFSETVQFAGPVGLRLFEARTFVGVLVHYAELAYPVTEHLG